MPLLASGCLLFAGAAAGSAAANARVTPDEDVDEYIRTHDVRPRIARALEREDVVVEMKPEHVALLLGDPWYTEEDDEGRTVWVYGTLTRRTFYTFDDKDGELRLVEIDTR